jgi:hypothetical protein
MSMTFDASGDLAIVADQLEPVQFRRRGKSGLTTIPHALRRRVQLREARPSRGDVTQSDVVWNVPLGELLSAPRPGDVIIDGESQNWTILDIEHTGATGNWRLLSRNLAVAAGLDRLVTIERAVLEKSTAGDLQPRWTDAWSGVRAKLQPVASSREEQHDQQAILRRYEVTLGEHLPITHDHRLRSAAGETFKIVGIDMPERIDQLPVLHVVSWPSE